MLRIAGKLLHPIAQLRHVHAQVLRRLHVGDAAILDQAHRLKLELTRELPPLHDAPPAPSKPPNSVSSEPGAGQYNVKHWTASKEQRPGHWDHISRNTITNLPVS